MKKLPPFLPGLSTKLQGSQRRRQLEIFRKERAAALRSSISDLGVLFHDILPAEWLVEIASDIRKRSYTQVTVFWAWISQVLEQNESSVNAVTLIQIWFKDNGLQPPAYDASSVANRIDIVRFYRIDIVVFGVLFPHSHRLLRPKSS